MDKWEQLADENRVNKVMSALRANGIDSYFVKDRGDARKKVLELIPAGAEVMTMSSTTLDQLGLSKELNEPGKFNSVRNKFSSMDKSKQGMEMRRLGAAHEFAVGSVHAITENGQAITASASGSQLPAYSYGAGKVIWVVGTHKIVKNLEEGMERVYQHSLPLENERAKKAYGIGSSVNKLLIVNREASPGRIVFIFVNEVLGF
ncbi:MAG: LUD domain-containing protein [Candidatus Micrarchaeia archaeon]